MENSQVIVGLGELLWDLLPEGPRIGGAPANFAFHVGRFGLQSCVASAVGDEPADNELSGDKILARLDSMGIRHCTERVPYPTGTVKVELNRAGIPQYDIRQNVAWDHIPYTDRLDALARRTRAVCFGSLAQRSETSRRTIRRFLEAIPAENRALKIFDANLRQNFYDAETLRDSMLQCNILKISDEEFDSVCRMSGCASEQGPLDPQERCRALIERYDLNMLILTCGDKGSHVFTPEHHSFLKTPKVKVADTVGAGDSFTAAFIASLLKGRSIAEAHNCAVEVSAYVCTQHGATPVLPADLTV